MRSVMKHQFSVVPRAEIPRSSFDRSHGLKTTFDAGYLIPIFLDEALPGDTFNCQLSAIARLATPIFPLMDNLRMDTHFFAVPMRLVWENFQKFCGEQENPGDSTDYTIPIMNSGAGYADGSIHDYFGLPTGVANIEHSSLFHRAYNLIWNEWYRDQNLQDSVWFLKNDGPDGPEDFELLRRGKRHDYFTSCLPWIQKGDSVDIPIGTSAPLSGYNIVPASANAQPKFDMSGTNGFYLSGDLANSGNVFWGGGVNPTGNEVGGANWDDPQLELDNNVYADLSTATAATINQLREAFQVQRLLERDARGGTRYVEILRSHFGVTSPDYRLQRPEYLGGGSTPVIVHQVAQTSSSDATSPQGNLSAFGAAGVSGHGFVKSFTEHCIIIGLVSVRADLTYQQGLPRMFSRSTRYDFYWPALANIGEQAVLNKEIYCDGSGNDELVFGYQERFAEYRYKPSLITGLMRSQAAQSLDSWHLSQEFGSLPVLGPDFIEENPPLDRCLAVPSEPHFIFDGYFNLKCARPMPVYSVPGLIDHF